MNVSDLEDIVGKVALEFFEHKNPGHFAAENPKTLHTCIDDVAFVITKFIEYFNQLAEAQINDGR